MCSINPSINLLTEIKNNFDQIIKIYKENDIIVNWYENEYKNFLLNTSRKFEINKYIFMIKNLQHHSSAYDCYATNNLKLQ